MAMSSAMTDRVTALKEFDDTKTGVKGLVDSGITSIPVIFHHPNISLSIPSTTYLSIPTVDLSLSRPIAVDLIRSACRNWGFFQLINHDIPLSTIENTISAVRSFHELPATIRSQHYRRTPGAGVSYFSNLDLFLSEAASWKDTLKITFGPVPPEVDQIPEVCRSELVAWDEQVKEVAKQVMGMMCEGLGVKPARLEDLTCLEGRGLAGQYYPPCPEPDRTFGSAEHTDAVVLTVLIQDKIGGLQVKSLRDESWIDVKPIPGALVVNVGDFLQIISNDEFKSVQHRVIANSTNEPRVSVAVFFNPGSKEDMNLYGPLYELISNEKPACYRNFNMSELVNIFLAKAVGCKSITEHFKHK
ncbi:1-aminocyclopropane-1-carboxylate oxidase homolog 3-like [Dioscorea cayenensis subsp. rotundata]|uniref:1-aminocyclopropane-1-carboxylate oxidase homolog 3-like n=1 Tax=Dioscorea cayennensis subsp. rotundata TaxID=55577 RepID=A0AB40D282_DIOCR|nr:1-aminocyclopropane-1-carboxylate oxidase homolog 3-like [Dioscorea cayenensis subsp. rotundata]